MTKDHVEGLEKKERDGEQTKRCWCLFSLWLVMGDCSQHKHMPSWLTHFLLHSISQRWATQAQNTTARCVCVCVCCLFACMYVCYACSLLLWLTWTQTVCVHFIITTQTTSAYSHEGAHTEITHSNTHTSTECKGRYISY